MALPQTSNLADIITAIQYKLNLDVFNGEGYCYVARNPGIDPTYTGEAFYVITIGPLVIDNRFFGKGIAFQGIKRLIQVTVAVRNSVDIAGEMILNWTAENYGLAFAEEAAINSLHLVNLRLPDTETNLLLEPMRLAPSSEAYVIDQNNVARDMTYSILNFEISYAFKTNRTI